MNKQIDFIVIDNNTGKQADISEIALKEDWAKGLMYCDMQGFAILDDGNLVLLDECGKYVYCPNGRFSVIPENAVVLTREEYDYLINDCKRWENLAVEKVDEIITTRKMFNNLLKEFYKRKSCGNIEEKSLTNEKQ